MIRCSPWLSLLLLAALLGSADSVSADEPSRRAADDFALIEVPDPRAGDNPPFPSPAMDMPRAGAGYVDSHFGTRIVRVTQEPGLRHEYARFDPLNADGTRVLLHRPRTGEFLVYRTAPLPFDSAKNLDCAVELGEPRWDPSSPELLWGIRDFRLETLNVVTRERRLVKDFSKDPAVALLLRREPDLYRATMKDEGEPSADLRYWALGLQGSRDDYRLRHVLVWDRERDRVLGLSSLAKSASDVDWIGMSPLGNWALIAGQPENRPHPGLLLADRELKSFHRIDYATAHGDVGLDAQGREVLVMQNPRTDYIDMIPLDPATRPILESGGAYQGTGRTPLVRLFYASDSPLGLQSGVHISCDMPGWCVVSAVLERGAKEQNWLDATIILVRLDAKQPRAWYLAKTQNVTGDYWEETHAAISRDGSKLFWAANFGKLPGRNQTTLLQLEMPTKWQQSLK